MSEWGQEFGWALHKVYDGLHWNAACASRGPGALLSALIIAFRLDPVVEIGIANAFTTQLFARTLAAMGGGTLISVDINDQSCIIGKRMTEGLPISHIVLEGDSKLINWPGYIGRAGMIYIDGDHSEEGACGDVAVLAPLVRVGGFICGHDYAPGQPGVMRAFDCLYADGRWERLRVPEFTDNGDLAMVVMRRLF